MIKAKNKSRPVSSLTQCFQAGNSWRTGTDKVNLHLFQLFTLGSTSWVRGVFWFNYFQIIFSSITFHLCQAVNEFLSPLLPPFCSLPIWNSCQKWQVNTCDYSCYSLHTVGKEAFMHTVWHNNVFSLIFN